MWWHCGERREPQAKTKPARRKGGTRVARSAPHQPTRTSVPDLPGYDPNYRGMEGPGETFSGELCSWIEEQNAINGAIAESVRRGLRRGGNKKAGDVAIWREFQKRRPTSKKSDTALTEEIGRKYGLKRSAAIEARKRGEKLAGS
jgi:hypothetical protein